MKKTLIVAAVSALTAGTAYAQSAVTLYGRFNVSVESAKRNNVTFKELDNNASRLGFKGIEDLGDGLKAGFVLEHGFNADTGTASSSAFWGRQSEVNLGGAYGTVRLGRFFSEAYYATADYVSMHNHDTGDSSDALYAYVGRNTNKVAYRLPTFVKGLSAEAAVSLTEKAAPYQSYDLAVNYNVGALALGLGYEKNDRANQVAVRALYDLGSFVFGGYVQRDRNGYGVPGLPAVNAGTRTNFRLSGAYILGTSEFHLNFGNAGKYSNVANSSAKQFTLAYNYNLSKRTKVYTYYTKVADSSAKMYVSGFGASPNSKEFSALAVGIRHNF